MALVLFLNGNDRSVVAIMAAAMVANCTYTKASETDMWSMPAARRRGPF